MTFTFSVFDSRSHCIGESFYLIRNAFKIAVAENLKNYVSMWTRDFRKKAKIPCWKLLTFFFKRIHISHCFSASGLSRRIHSLLHNLFHVLRCCFTLSAICSTFMFGNRKVFPQLLWTGWGIFLSAASIVRVFSYEIVLR